MRINTRNHVPAPRTEEGAVAQRINAEQQLRRSVMACLLWESNFYEDGVSIADRIKNLISKVDPETVADIALEAREDMKLRHAPLLIAREMARLESHRHLVSETLYRVIQRADELSEFVSIYWKDKKQPLSGQVKKGLARAFTKFNEYALAKYNRDNAVKLRDVLFLCHAKPADKAQEKLWKKLVEDKLATPDTWEVALSASKGEAKKAVWTRLLKEGKVPPLAFIRNLRNFVNEGVDSKLVKETFKTLNTDRLLPYNFVTAARFCPDYEPELEAAMLKCLEGAEKIPGKTVLLVDVSGSMGGRLSTKGDTTCLDAACGLAILAREMFEDVQILTFSNELVKVPARRGFALRDGIVNSQQHGGTWLGKSVETLNKVAEYDRLVVITDEQSHDTVPNPKGRGYVINVSSNQNGIGYGKWIHIDGWSEHVIRYLNTVENIKPLPKRISNPPACRVLGTFKVDGKETRAPIKTRTRMKAKKRK